MKRLKWIAILPVFVMVLTGCGKKENLKSILATAEKKMDDLSNYTMNIEMKIGFKAPGFELLVPAAMETKVDQKTQTAKANITFEILGMKLSTESYTQTVDGKTITYSKEIMSDIWTKETEDASEEDNLFIADHLKKMERKKSDDTSTNRYQITLSKEDTLLLFGKGNTDDLKTDEDVVIDIYVDKKSNCITKLSVDLKDVMIMEENFAITSAMITITLSDFDQVGMITIPEDVITGAIEQSDDWNYEDFNNFEL